MNNRDSELDEILKPIRELEPNFGQRHRWSALLKRNDFVTRSLQWAVAASIGFLVGAMLFKTPTQQVAFDSSDTRETIYVSNR